MHSSVGTAGRAFLMLACVVGLLVWAVADAPWSEVLKKLQSCRLPAILEPVAASTSAPLEEAPRFTKKASAATAAGNLAPASMSAPLCSLPTAAVSQKELLQESRSMAIVPASYQATESAPAPALTNMVGNTAENPASSGDPYQMIQDRLRELGATYYLLESWGTGQQMYRFYCKMAVGGNADYTRYFEASHADPLQAMHDVLAQVELWRNGTKQ